VEKKQNRAIEKTKNTFGKIKEDKLRRRVSDTYIDENKTLVKTLINTKGKNIKNKIKKTKIEKVEQLNSSLY
jgi:ribosomal protein S17E